MPVFPDTPLPSQVSAPALMRPIYRFSVDSGIEFRRPRTSRPLRRYMMEWLGKTTYEMHLIRDFVNTTENGALPFQWIHPTAKDVAIVSNTSPITLTYSHGLVTGQWVYITNGPGGANGAWQVTRLDALNLTLFGSSAAGFGNCLVAVYLPYAVAKFDGDIWESPVKLLGPEQFDGSGVRINGRFSWNLTVEEVF